MSDQRRGGIAWTDETWNPVRGCSRVSEGCRNCYAERMAARFSWVSAEPLLGPLKLGPWLTEGSGCGGEHPRASCAVCGVNAGRLDWVVVGGESGPGARPCRVEWVHSIVEDCKASEGTACFVKQLGAHAVLDPRYDRTLPGWRRLRDRAGADPEEWPQSVRQRELP